VTHGTRTELLREVGLDSEGITQAAMEMIRQKNVETRLKPKTNGTLFKRLARRRGGESKTGKGTDLE